MSTHCSQADLAYAYALQSLPAAEVPAVEAHVASCPHCRKELEALRPVLDSLAYWPTDVLRPTAGMQERLAQRIGAKSATPDDGWREPEWEKVAPGISVKLLANDTDKHVVSMLVRLEPGASYPAHTHAGVEELHLLHGELWIDGRKLHPGDYNRGEPGAGDQSVWSETGCTCLLITSTRDVLR